MVGVNAAAQYKHSFVTPDCLRSGSAPANAHEQRTDKYKNGSDGDKSREHGAADIQRGNIGKGTGKTSIEIRRSERQRLNAAFSVRAREEKKAAEGMLRSGIQERKPARNQLLFNAIIIFRLSGKNK